MIEVSEEDQNKADIAFDTLHLGIFDETDASRYLKSPMLRSTFAADYAERIDFSKGEVLRAVLSATDILSADADLIPIVLRAKAQLLFDSATIYQRSQDEGTLSEYLKRIQNKESNP